MRGRRNLASRLGAIALGVIAVTGCGSGEGSGPPALYLDDSICAQCGMIISDVRFAAATVVTEDRGASSYLFDDYNCQVNFEVMNPGMTVSSRWAHDYESGQWTNAEQTHYLRSDNLKTPMASHVAAFGSAEAARDARDELGGDVVPFAGLSDGSLDDH